MISVFSVYGSPFNVAVALASSKSNLTVLLTVEPFATWVPSEYSQLPVAAVLSIVNSSVVLLPATTALGTLDPIGREKGIMSGANVVMPNLSPPSVRKKYMLYDNKLSDGAESAQAKQELEKRISSIGYNIVVSRGDIYKENNEGNV